MRDGRERFRSQEGAPSTAQMSARRWLFPGAAPAVGLLLLFLSSFCGRADVRDQVLSGWMELRLNNDALSPVHVFCHIQKSLGTLLTYDP
jgi:hypothetical protein